MADAMWMKIRDVSWDDYEVSSDVAVSMPTILKNLSSRKLPRAIKASHQLWTALCGGGQLYSAVVPVIPLLLEIFIISEPVIQDSIMEILERCESVELDADWSEDLGFILVQAKENLAFLNIRDELVKQRVQGFCSES